MLTAWADESGSRADLDPGAYLLAAVLCDDDDIADMRKTLEGLRIGESKLHWHGSSEERRGELIERQSLAFRSPDSSLSGFDRGF